MVLRALEHTAAGAMDVRISMELAVRRSCGCPQEAPISKAAPRARSSTRRRDASSDARVG
jgi:hypothetical protein